MSTIGFKPIMGRVALEFIRPDKTNSGIYVGDTLSKEISKSKPLKVLAVFQDCKEFKEGDYVYLSGEGQGQVMNFNGVEVLIVQLHHIIGVAEGYTELNVSLN